MNILWKRLILWGCTRHIKDNGIATTAIQRMVQRIPFLSTADSAPLTCAILACTFIIKLTRCFLHFMNILWNRLILWRCTRHIKGNGSATTAIQRMVQRSPFLSTADSAPLTCAILACTFIIKLTIWFINITCCIWKPADSFTKIRMEFGDVLFAKRLVIPREKPSHSTAQPAVSLTFAAAAMNLRGIQSTIMNLKWWIHRWSIHTLVAAGFVTSVAAKASRMKCKWDILVAIVQSYW